MDGYVSVGARLRRAVSSLTGSAVSRAVLCAATAAAAAPMAVWADESELIKEAAQRMSEGEYELAMQVYDAFITRYPNSESIADVHYGRGVSLYYLGRYEEALGTFDLIENRYGLASFRDELPYWTGLVRYQLGDYQAAALDFKRFTSSGAEPGLRPQALLHHGLAELRSGRVAAAQAPLAELLRQSEDVNNATLAYAAALLAHSYLAGGQHEELIAFASGLPAASYPQGYRDQLLFYQAEALWALDRIESATAIYRQLVGADPEIGAPAHRRLFAAARRSGDIDAMQSWTDSAESRFASSPEILIEFWLRLGIENYERGADQLAELFLRRVWDRELAAGRTEGTAPLYLAKALMLADASSGDDPLAEAKEVLERLIELAPGRSAEARLMLGGIALEERRFAEAAALYNDFGRRYPASARRAEAAYLAAYAFYRAGDLSNAAGAAEGARNIVKGSEYHDDLLRLRANLARSDGRPEIALQRLDELIELLPGEAPAQIDRMKLAFDVGDHVAVIQYADYLRAAFPDLAVTDPVADAVAAYLQGVSEIALKRYHNGIELLRRPGLQRAMGAELANLAADADYWLGWALYRLGEFAQAVAVLEPRRNDDEALYLAAWAYYSGERFEEAAVRFGELAERAGAGLAGNALYLYAKSLRNLGRVADAQRSYRDVWERFPADDIADDALFEYAETAAEAGDAERAVTAFETLVERYPDSALRAEALFRSAESLFDEGHYRRAKDGFFRYRQEYPTGESVPAALYWGGMAAHRLEERPAAELLWSSLVERFPDSTFQPDALNLLADVYEAEANYRAALQSLEQLMARHPEQAAALGAEDRMAELRLRMSGLTGTEAELSASVARLGGDATAEGRKAMLELARLYVLDRTAPVDRAFGLLQDVISTARNSDVLANAHFLLGQYYLRRQDPSSAAQSFLDAALVDGAGEDVRVEAIYRSANAEAQAGRPDAARALAQRILDNFPDSPWAGAARAIAGEE